MEKNKAIVTTGRKMQADSVKLAKSVASKLNLIFVERENSSLEDISTRYQVQNILIAKKNSLRLITSGSEVFFHPNLSHLRIKNLKNGNGDRLIEAMNLQCGMSVLDCTMGLGSDAIVESYIVGSKGSVTAIEINPYLAAVVEHGLKTFKDENPDVISAMRRIKVINIDYLNFLKAADTNSFDVVYFDPMFRHALERSSNLNSIRGIADHRAVSIESINEACRVAKYRVVLKENAKSLEFQRLGFEKICGGKYSPIHYGVKTTTN